MKVKVNERERMVAVYLRKLQCWDIVSMTTEGKQYHREATKMSFTPVFSEAITDLRSKGHDLTHQGWESGTIETRGLNTHRDAVQRAWNKFVKES